MIPATLTALATLCAILAWPAPPQPIPPRTNDPRRTLPARFRTALLGLRGQLREILDRCHARDRADQALLTVIDALRPALEAGLPPGWALSEAATACPDPTLRAQLAQAAVRGKDGDGLGRALTAIQQETSEETRTGAGPELLAGAWTLAERLGTPLAAATDTVAGIIRDDLAARRAVEQAVTEARATVRVLLVLPLAGPVIGAAVGIHPGDLYGSAAPLLSALIGLSLTALGHRWMTRLVARVETAGGTP